MGTSSTSFHFDTALNFSKCVYLDNKMKLQAGLLICMDVLKSEGSIHSSTKFGFLEKLEDLATLGLQTCKAT